MDAAEERKLALRIVREAGAEKTAAAIKDPDACYGTILQTAIDEIGMEELTDLILKSEPVWAYKMLGLFPEIGAEKEALVNKALEDERFNSYVGATSQNPDSAFGKSSGGFSAENLGASIPVVQIRVTSSHKEPVNLALRWLNNDTVHEHYYSDPQKGRMRDVVKNESAPLEPKIGPITRADISPGDEIWVVARIPIDSRFGQYQMVESDIRFLWYPTLGEEVNGQVAGVAYLELTPLPDAKLVFSHFIG